MLRVGLGPVTVVRETTKGQVRHRLREQRKVPGYTESHSNLLYSSSLPKHTLNSIPFSQFLRLSDDNDFISKCIDMRSFFINRRYPAAVVQRAKHKAFSVDRITALTPKTRAASDRIPFTVTFHPVKNSIKPIVNRYFNLLNSYFSTSNISSQRPLISFKKDRNRRTFLFKGTLSSSKDPCTFRCSPKRCLICNFTYHCYGPQVYF